MDYKLAGNGWTVIIDDFNMEHATQDDINFICKLISRHTLVVIKNQPTLSVERQLEIIHMFKDPSPLFNREDQNFIDTAVDPDGLICRVTAEKNENGKI